MLRTSISLGAFLTVAVARAQTYEVVQALRPSSGGPQGMIVEETPGRFFGGASTGGTFLRGSIFLFGTNGSGYDLAEIHAFSGADGASPVGGLTRHPDGYFYGTCRFGGAHDLGTIFRAADVGLGRVTVLHDFQQSDGANPTAGLTVAADGSLYGTTMFGGAGSVGTLFRYDPGADTFATVYEFHGTDGAIPQSEVLVTASGDIYGTTAGGGAHGNGTVFHVDPTGAFTTLHDFNSTDGSGSRGKLVEIAPGTFWGTASAGGANSRGTIFQIDASGGSATIHDFSGADGSFPPVGLTPGVGGDLYGVTSNGGSADRGTIFKIDPTGTLTTLHEFEGTDGEGPSSPILVGSDGFLYGATGGGGRGHFGTIFRLDMSGTLTEVFSFGEGEGTNSSAGLLPRSDGLVLGTADQGGVGYGTLFSLDQYDSLSPFYRFTGPDGGDVRSGLVIASNGYSYGVSYGWGANGFGNIFMINAVGLGVTPIHDFNWTDGAYPSARLLAASDGALYGVTERGGTNDQGTIFKTSTVGEFASLYSFDQVHGALPLGGLIEGTDGNLYGTTPYGGEASGGSVFKVDTSGNLTTLHSFAGGSEGYSPSAALVQGSDGSFYGSTVGGGDAFGTGTLFRIDSLGALTTLHTFHGPDGSTPRASLIQAADGYFYGTTAAGGNSGDNGTIFRMDAAGAVTMVHNFGGLDGSAPQAELLESPDGDFYGTTAAGGFGNAGVVFRVSATAPPPSVNWIEPSSGRAAGGASALVTGTHFRPGVIAAVGDSPIPVVNPDARTIATVVPAFPPGTLHDVAVINVDAMTAVLPAGWFANFLDSDSIDLFHDEIEAIVRAGITAGCGGGNYCAART